MLRWTSRRLCAAGGAAASRGPRSDFKYEGAVNATDSLGARNEAAYLPYKAFEPEATDIVRRFALPSFNNLLTTMAVEVLILVALCAGISVALWDVWVTKKYEVVRLLAPKH